MAANFSFLLNSVFPSTFLYLVQGQSYIFSRLTHYYYKTFLSSINPINIINLLLWQFL